MDAAIRDLTADEQERVAGGDFVNGAGCGADTSDGAANAVMVFRTGNGVPALVVIKPAICRW